MSERFFLSSFRSRNTKIGSDFSGILFALPEIYLTRPNPRETRVWPDFLSDGTARRTQARPRLCPTEPPASRWLVPKPPTAPAAPESLPRPHPRFY